MAAPVTKERRLETVAVLALVCIVLTALKHHHTGIPARADAGLYAAGIFLIVGLFIPPLGVLITRGWFGLSHLLGGVVSRIVLAVVFFLVLTPLALIRRLFEKDHLKLEREHGDAPTYFVTVNRKFGPEDLKRLW